MAHKPTPKPPKHDSLSMLCEIHCWVGEIRTLTQHIQKEVRHWGKPDTLTPQQQKDLQQISVDLKTVTATLNAADRDT